MQICKYKYQWEQRSGRGPLLTLSHTRMWTIEREITEKTFYNSVLTKENLALSTSQPPQSYGAPQSHFLSVTSFTGGMKNSRFFRGLMLRKVIFIWLSTKNAIKHNKEPGDLILIFVHGDAGTEGRHQHVCLRHVLSLQGEWVSGSGLHSSPCRGQNGLVGPDFTVVHVEVRMG